MKAGSPSRLRPRFRFHGSKPRDEILPYLARACAAAVPSRWENFPNVCIEAMRTGLPVIATRLGGMGELLEDGRTGWLTPDTGVAGMADGLVDALQRCVATPASERADMGRAASEAVAQICDNDAITGAQLAFREAVVSRGARRSRSATPPHGPKTPCATARTTARLRAGVVIKAASTDDAAPLQASLMQQTRRPAAVAVVCSDKADPATAVAGDPAADEVLYLRRPEVTGAAAWNAGFEALAGRGVDFWLFLDEHDALDAGCLDLMEHIFRYRSDVGLIAPWTVRGSDGLLEAPIGTDIDHQLERNELTPATAVRAGALNDAQPFNASMPREFDIWSLGNSALMRGWTAVGLPAAYAYRRLPPPIANWPNSTAIRAIRSEVLAPVAGSVGPVVLDFLDRHVPLPMTAPQVSKGIPSLGVRGRRYLRTLVFEPRKALRALARRSAAIGRWGA